jgi:hypothetical protein
MKVTRERKVVLLGELSGGDVAGGRGKVGLVEARLNQQHDHEHDHETGVDTGAGGMLLKKITSTSASCSKTRPRWYIVIGVYMSYNIIPKGYK